ncbi:hypothetical protein JHK82_039729 [Glycine max]|nr:hypothetical protein JHK86_039923 [Glycine max]KAG4965529.1 hypothetical protein JHK85_040504 [Glycine max]KAG5110506.1 hypothetical protein JHK82_039729 [Glycine max]KAG5121797.1 hypothetical protein JHK84_040137 [Glycine max]
MDGDAILGLRVCINDALTDDDVLHLILGRVERQEDKEVFRLSLAKYCGNLETLLIGGGLDVSTDVIEWLVIAFQLKILWVEYCQNISYSTVRCILSQCRNLEALSISGGIELTDATFQLIGNEEAGLSLKILDLHHCCALALTPLSLKLCCIKHRSLFLGLPQTSLSLKPISPYLKHHTPETPSKPHSLGNVYCVQWSSCRDPFARGLHGLGHYTVGNLNVLHFHRQACRYFSATSASV